MADVQNGRSTSRGRRRRVGAALTLVVALSGLIRLDTSPARGGLVPIVEFTAFHSAKAMDVLGASHTPGAEVVQWTPNGGDNQLWRLSVFAPVGDVDLVIVQSVESGLVLDVAGGSTGNGAALVQNAWSGAASQLWILLPIGDTEFLLLANVNSGKVADVSGASTVNGAPIVQWTWHGGFNQIFSGVAVAV